MRNILEMAKGVAKRSEIWGPEILVNLILDTFHLVVSKVPLRLFGARLPKWSVTRKRL